MIPNRISFFSRPLAMVLAVSCCLVSGRPLASPTEGVGEDLSSSTLAAYRALAASRSRDYDSAQDISPRQLVMLLEVIKSE